MKKKRIPYGQAMVEYALLVTMVVVSMIVIMGTLQGSVGSVWQAVVDNFETNPSIFVVATTPVYTTAETSTPTMTATNTELPPGAPSLTPTNTLEFTFTPTATNTALPTDTPTATATTVVEVTPVPTATAVMHAVNSAVVKRNLKAIRVTITVNRTVNLTVKDTLSNITQTVTCTTEKDCIVKFDPLPGGGFIEIRSAFGDSINLSYPPEH
jgi:Flp pilus assembly pilin Flp